MKLRCEAGPLQHVQYAPLFYKCFSLEAASILYLHQSAVSLSLWQQILLMASIALFNHLYSFQVESTDERIDMEQLKVKEKIYFYEDVIGQ